MRLWTDFLAPSLAVPYFRSFRLDVHEACDSTPALEKDLKEWNDGAEKWGSEHCMVALETRFSRNARRYTLKEHIKKQF